MQASLPLGLRAHNNRGLFADHYLDHPERLQALDEWRQATGIEEAFRKLAHLYSDKAVHFNRRINEPQTEHDFIRPVLNLLWREQRAGDCYQVQVTIPNVDVRRQPDYAFFRTAQDRRDAEARKGSLDYWRDVPALGDAKAWFASLDKQRGADDNPTAQICNYLYRSRVRWGILTNGRIWRLYEREKSSAGGIYYEVDLEELLQRGDLEAFKYFYLFFRREAFLPDDTGLSLIERVFQGSVDYAAEVGDRLKDSVYDALRLLMNGFFEYPANQLNRDDPATVKLVHENCLIVLYRLLFLLYAEDRDLLPRHDELYANYSLYHLQRAINQRLRTGGTYLPMSRGLWGELTNLFQLIDTGFEEGGIPAYNGGLFSPSKYPHIAHTPQSSIGRWEIGDRRLAHVIDMLAYQREHRDEAGTQDVDYNSLDVQHLGSIYEGLLELQPHIATEPMVETLVDGKLVFKPTREVPSPRPIRGQPPRPVNMGEVYLVTDRGERKATGSYYTPTYIVDYIVEHTVGPLAEEAVKAVAALLPEVNKEIAKLERTRREWQKSSAADAACRVEGLSKLIENQKRRLLEPYLTLKILDPAMGSGHFLVGAADFLSLAMATDPDLLALSEMGDEDSQAFYKRLVVERCLYGVDVNPLAVELAKLSLWLHTVSRDKALSFLDHHLRCGNSLIGARIEDDLMKEPPQFDARGRRTNANSQQFVLGFTEALTATHLQYFLDTFRKIMETPSGDAAMERQKDELYRAMDAVRDKFRAVANCWLAPFFGIPIIPEEYERAVHTLRGTDAERAALAQETWFKDVQTVAQQKRFFHWELEFPEIFFDKHGSKPKKERGFDAVIGNPPYFLLQGREEQRMCQWLFSDIFSGSNDIAHCFLRGGIDLLVQERELGFIVTRYWLEAFHAAKLRQVIASHAPPRHIVDFGNLQVWADVNVLTVLVILRKGTPSDKSTLDIVLVNEYGTSRTKGAEQILTKAGAKTIPSYFHVPCTVLGSEPWYLRQLQSRELWDKIWKVSCKLDELTQNTQGIKTGYNEAFVVSKEYAEKSHLEMSWLLPVAQAADIVIHSIENCGEFLIYTDGSISIDMAPSIRAHLEQFKSVLEQRDECNKGLYPWWRLQRPRHPYIIRSPQKILVPLYATHNRFAFDSEGFVGLTDIYMIIKRQNEYSLQFIVAVLDSKLLNTYQISNCKIKRAGYLEYVGEVISNFPIRRIIFTTPSNERSQLLEQGKGLYERCLPESNNDYLLGFVDHELAQTPERADVVHDLLAFLAKQMIEMNKEKQTEVKGFITWLERTIGTAVDELNNKTKIKVYHEYEGSIPYFLGHTTGRACEA